MQLRYAKIYVVYLTAFASLQPKTPGMPQLKMRTEGLSASLDTD